MGRRKGSKVKPQETKPEVQIPTPVEQRPMENTSPETFTVLNGVRYVYRDGFCVRQELAD